MTSRADVDRFCALARELPARVPALAGLFDAGQPLAVARAPGRLDVMGGFADYSGSLVLEMPIREAALAAAAPAAAPVVRVATVDPARPAAAPRQVTVDLAALEDDGGGDPAAAPYARARAWFAARPDDRWAAYVAGTVLVLRRERGLSLDGASILLASDVPEGKGVSSSAAIEVAAMRAVAAAAGLELDPADLARLCQRVENLVVGAPCGVMDQMTAACGREGRLLEILCQPADIRGQLAVPSGASGGDGGDGVDGVEFFGIDSGVRHAVTGADYGDVRVGAFMGYRMITARAGLSARDEDRRWRGYLANVTPEEFARDFAPHLPERIAGNEFLRRFGGISDLVTRVDPGKTYPVLHPTAHPVHEHARVQEFAALLRAAGVGGGDGGGGGAAALDEHARLRLGQLMYESHASYSACGLGSHATDALVAAVRAAGPAAGLYGAKISGGGSGGTVVVLARASALAAVREIAARHAAARGGAPYVFAGSSPGAGAFGVVTVSPA